MSDAPRLARDSVVPARWRELEELREEPNLQYVHRLCEDGPEPTRGRTLLDALAPLLAELRQGPEFYPPDSTVPLDCLGEFVGDVYDLACEEQLLGNDDLDRIRETLYVGLTHVRVHYYRRLEAEQGSKWANGLKRAEEFRALLADGYPTTTDLSAFVDVLEREHSKEGAAFHDMFWTAGALLNELVGQGE